jgi:hypothetical protein
MLSFKYSQAFLQLSLWLISIGVHVHLKIICLSMNIRRRKFIK